ncbi:transglutaminase family protein [Aurantimonas sp. VKM B-3413]|uniref:transglutaminase family protein n=1 Tax=Aurantimonas sp. VKM B-3413 TaxID=2779401 RepID=UPI001E657608|nr:transglutaminase family protein [Aurantimonas sp. VKM B-3413]MCB8839050.1 transglutaminase family protein [Aurantimonas sp. VKM B-3413]
MIYDLTLKIGYEYPSAAADARHVLRVRPREEPGQSVERTVLTVTPRPDEHHAETDFFGNPVDAIAYHRPHTALKVEMRARVALARRSIDLADTPTRCTLADLAFLSRESDGASPIHFLAASRRAAPLAALSAYAGEILADASVGAGILALADRIKADFAYVPGSTGVGTTVAEAFDSRRGVCQDFSHVMIAGLRANGIPAGYVSGFLRTDPPPGRPRLEGADAMHAWVTAWLGPDCGWVGFDPTNGVVAADDHVSVAVGRDYDDVAPVAGVFVTAGTQKTFHSVDVVPLPAAPAAEDRPARPQ